MLARKAGETRLQRHGNISLTDIEHNQTKSARAQQFLSGPWNRASIGSKDNHQGAEIDPHPSGVGRIEKTFNGCAPTYQLALPLRFERQIKNK